MGGAGRWALFSMGDWHDEGSSGCGQEVRLSNQGYYCKAKNVLTDIEKILRITKGFYKTGRYDSLDNL